MRYAAFIVLAVFFAFCSKDDNSQSIIGTWHVDSYVQNSNSAVVYGTDSITLTFNSDKSLGISLEVNSCGGEYTIGDGNLSISNIFCTKACCDSEFSQATTALLSKINAYHFVNEDLKLTGDSSAIIYLKPIQ